MLKKLGVVMAEVDLHLKYVWIENPHLDFDPNSELRKRDDELIFKEEAEGLLSLKRKVSFEKQRLD